MIVTKTPLRVSFFGGGSDIHEYYERKPGLVLSTTIDSFIYLAVNRCVADHLKVVYSELELTGDVDDIKHNRVRETLKYFEVESNFEICSFSDVPVKGTGLGSSSTFTVGLVNAIGYSLHGRRMTKREMADLACYIEIDRCLEPIGKQDQYAAAYGGFNEIRFEPTETHVKRLKIDPSVKLSLENRLLFFDTGVSRSAQTILRKQVERIRTSVNVGHISSLVAMAEQAIRHLQMKKLNEFGELLGDAWDIKKKLSDNVSDANIDEMYDTAVKAGALGGKILGAGGGGYLMVYAPLSRKARVVEAMSKYSRRHFKFYNRGTSIEMRR